MLINQPMPAKFSSTQFWKLSISHSSYLYRHTMTTKHLTLSSYQPTIPYLVTDLSVLPVSPSDHFLILSYLKLVNLPRQPVTRSTRHINTINIDTCLYDIAEEPPLLHRPTILDELVLAYNSTLTKLLDKHAPLIHKNFPPGHPVPGLHHYCHVSKLLAVGSKEPGKAKILLKT